MSTDLHRLAEDLAKSEGITVTEAARRLGTALTSDAPPLRVTSEPSAAASVTRSTCLEPVWYDGIYRVRCSMGTAGVCARHGKHRPHPDDGRTCEPNPHDGYCHTHGVYMDLYEQAGRSESAGDGHV